MINDHILDKWNLFSEFIRRCLGSTQHLKAKYGSGYVLEIKLDTSIAGDLGARISGLHSHVLTLFSTADWVESFAERVTYNIPQKSVASLSSVFGSLEEGRLA